MLAAAERWGGGADERPYLPRAFSIARRRDGEAQFLLEDVGPGTRRLCELRAASGCGCSGRSGAGFAAPRGRPRARCSSAAASGIAPLAILAGRARRPPAASHRAARLPRRRARRTARALLRGARVATDDGSVGHHGLVTELLERELERGRRAPSSTPAAPRRCSRRVRALCARARTPAQLALEAGMACGFGACFGCVVPARGGGYLRVCVDGPVLDAASCSSASRRTRGRPA